jgi:putative endonuclease
MAGHGPAIHEPQFASQTVRSLSGTRLGVFHDQPAERYTLHRVTDDLVRRVWEHREGVVDGFTKRYGLKYLVYFEQYDDIRDARQREQNLKHYLRAWKIRLILLNNPSWSDLFEQLP